MANIIAIVEGDGEVEAVPVLIRRICGDVFPDAPPNVLKPIRVRRDRILKEGELERYVSLAAVRVGDDGRILILQVKMTRVPGHESDEGIRGLAGRRGRGPQSEEREPATPRRSRDSDVTPRCETRRIVIR